MTFDLSQGALPDAIDLELVLLGVLDERVDESVLATDQAALAEATALFERLAPPLPRATPVRDSPVEPVRWWRIAVAVSLPLAAAALLVAWTVLQPADDGVRAMGSRAGLAVDVRTADERLWLSVTPETGGYVSVATLQEDGRVSVLVSGDAMPVSAGVSTPVDGVVRLDGYTGREWLILERTASPLPPAAVERRAAALLPDPTRSRSADRWVMEVTDR